MLIHGRNFRCYKIHLLQELTAKGFKFKEYLPSLKTPGRYVWVYEMSEELKDALEEILDCEIIWEK